MQKLKDKVLFEINTAKQQLSIFEYIAWWILRIAMIITAIIFTYTEAQYVRNLVVLNTLATMAIPFFRFISPKKLFISRVTYRCQTYIDIFVFAGSFLGHGLKFIHKIPEYDKMLHVVAGGVVVFIGAELLKAFRGHEKVSPGIKTFCGVGFSFIIIVLWEIMEFFSDYYILNSNNQGYYIRPDESMLFVKIFGISKNFPDNAPVYDTNVDMFYAVIGCFICAAILYAYLNKQEKKKSITKAEVKEEELSVQ